MNLKQLLPIFFFINNTFSIQAQTAPSIQWQQNVGNIDNYSAVASVIQTIDLGYASAGYIQSNTGMYNCKVVKFNSAGNIDWQQRFDTSVISDIASIRQTLDAGYVAIENDYLGSVSSVYIQKAFVSKLNNAGEIEWRKRYGSNNYLNIDQFSSIQQTLDGGFIVTGMTNSNDGDVAGNHGGIDCWLLKLDDTGRVEWSKCYGGTKEDKSNCVVQTSDGNYLFCGSAQSNDGEVVGSHSQFPDYPYDAWIVKVDNTGEILWQKCFGGMDWEEGICVQETMDGNYIFSVNASSNDGDFSGSYGNGDTWLIKMDRNGNVLWKKYYGGSMSDQSSKVKNTIDGGYVLVSTTFSNDEDVNGNHNTNSDIWVLKLDSLGNIQWQKCLGGSGYEWGLDICQTSDAGYFIGGISGNCGGDVQTCYYGEDGWVLKLGPSPVPLTLTSFSAQKQRQSILLNWQTQTEINTKHFVVEKSNNAIDYKTLNTIAASGNSSTTKNYSCTDASPFNGTNYYRLKQVDKDGSFVYSKTVAVNFSTKVGVVYPNPALSVITVIPTGELKAIIVINAEGKIVQQMQPTQNNKYNISRLFKGIYSLRLCYADRDEIIQMEKQ